jgi:hypothetical protein
MKMSLEKKHSSIRVEKLSRYSDGLEGRGSIHCRGKVLLDIVHTGTRAQPASVQWVPRAISPRIKRPGREADCLTPSNSEVNNGGDTHPLANVFMA